MGNQPTYPANHPSPGAPSPYGQPPQPPAPGSGTPYGNHPAPPQPQSPRPKWKTALLATGAAVVLLSVSTGTAWFVATTGTTGGGLTAFGGGSSDGAEWDVPLPNAGSGDFTTALAFGSWLTDKVIIRAQKDGVLAYDLTSGKRSWGIPSPGAQLCGATPDLSAGKAAIAYGSSSSCDHLAGIDATTGKLTWKIKIPAEKSTLANSINVPRIMSADGVAVTELDDAVAAYRLTDGHKLWGLTASPDDGCHIKDINTAATRVAVILDCTFRGGTRLQYLDPKTGKITKQATLGQLSLMTSLLSASPAIIRSESGGQNTFTVYSDAATKVTEIKTPEVDMLAMNTVAMVDGLFEQHRYTIHDDRLYLATFPQNVPQSMRSRNKALAYDLKTGKQLWESSGTQDTILTYIRADDQGLLALETGDRRDLAPRLVRLDAATGKATELATLPQKYGTEAEKARVFERNGVVITVPWTSVATRYAVTYVNTKAN
ncbi:PQQ-binding-like beta-propeller repeat protein [Nonomuraea sp. NPDC049684]|uniref:outer membrane protein assembly factor BamB family protein n=1 Tax=Nonomuraea sp. NPDC049684 TaxID=3364356 RepID=UPI0037A427DF